MSLDGTAWASWASRFATYAEGKAPLKLVPVTLECGVAVPTGAAGVPFVHDGEEEGVEPTETVLMQVGELDVRTRTRLAVGTTWAYAGSTWQVAAVGDAGASGVDVMAGVAWHHGARLVRHAG